MAEKKKSFIIGLIAVLLIVVIGAGVLWYFLAQDKGKYTFSYVLNGQEVMVKADNYDDLMKKLPPMPRKDGFVFGGYYFDENFKIPLTDDGIIERTKNNDVISLYLCWNSVKNTTIPKGLLYEEKADGVIITGCENKDIISCVIPDVINNTPVTKIGQDCFNGCSKLTSVTLPIGLKEIGDGAFCNESSRDANGVLGSGRPILALSTVNILNLAGFCEVKSCSIGGPFDYFPGQGAPGSVATGGKYTYLYIDGQQVEDLVIPNGVKIINNYIFRGCCGIKNVTIPSSVETIGSLAFADCPDLKNVQLVEGIKEIKYQAFDDSKLSSINLVEGIEEIGISAFYKTNLKDVIIPNSVTSLGNKAFSGCDMLQTCKIGDGVTKLESELFGSVSKYGSGYDTNCSSLKKLYIGKNVESIQCDLKQCDALERIDVDVENKFFSSLDGVLFDKNKTEMIVFPIIDLSSSEYIYSIPDTVKNIYNSKCFSRDSTRFHQKNVHGLIIPTSVRSLYPNFSGLSNFEKIYYKGTAAQWGNIHINLDEASDNFINATLCFYIENEDDVPDDEGTYWHYGEDGVTPIIW